MRNVFLRAQESAWLERQMRRRAFARKAVSRFMPGESADDAMAAAGALARMGLSSVLTELGENVSTEADVTVVRQAYENLLGRLAKSGLPGQVSVKLTHLGLDLSDAVCREQVRRLADVAARLRNVVWIDMEGSVYTDRTLDIFRSICREHDNMGVCVQAYLYRTADDLERLAALSPAIRLVKGAYQEPASIAFPNKRDVDDNYFALARRLLEDPRFRSGTGPAFGTHDLPLLRRITAMAADLGVARDAFEIQMLYGIRRADQQSLAGEGFTVRILISYGEAWFPWYMRRLAERPANVWFVVRSMFGG